jgi:hypothetical protein
VQSLWRESVTAPNGCWDEKCICWAVRRLWRCLTVNTRLNVLVLAQSVCRNPIDSQFMNRQDKQPGNHGGDPERK